MTVVLVPIIATYGRDGVLVVGLLAGVILVAMAIAGLGRFVQFIPLPVIEGFTVGIAVIIALQQVPDCARAYRRRASSVLAVAINAVRRVDQRTRRWAAALSGGVMALMLVGSPA